MKAKNTLKGQALRTYNKVMNAMAEDNDASMLHTFAALTQQAKSIALQSGKFSNAYVCGELKGMTAEEAAKDLTARAAACVTCKVRNIDMIIAIAFLAEYISRQRKEIETPNTTPSTSETMNTETKAMNEEKTNTLTLSKCAYIFHWSNSIYFRGTREQIAHKAAVNRALKAVYEDPAKGVNLPYVMENNRAYIELDGLKIDVCDTMLQSISGEYPNAEIVNGRTFKDLTPFYESFKPGTFTRFNACADGQQYFWGAKLKSIEFEASPSPDGLRFYRLHFRGNSLVLIASNGKIYNAGGSTYNEMTTGDVLHRLDAESKAAKIILTKFIKYIKE